MLDMTSRELEDAIEDVRGQVRKQSNRIVGLSYEYGREIERLKTAVRQIQAALNLPQLADEN